ncbi:hypothetical protein CAEBREN_10111 [Caenorhabditis brenneri]|uniref:BTB domain-containing protein n=1 Tax=Caenorhabditis brenneri TaxID=135651 RepID=G0MVW1_CAEBE|nr:hypothetical protein CAEBREN_10111 [Caenorhabditis brenneri]
MSDLKKLFAKSDETDAVLVVQGHKMHVNKAFDNMKKCYCLDFVTMDALDLADRFLLPHLKSLLELSLIVSSEMDFWSKVETGGKHQLNDLLDNGLKEMKKSGVYRVSELRSSATFRKLPASAQVKILTRYLELFYF